MDWDDADDEGSNGGTGQGEAGATAEASANRVRGASRARECGACCCWLRGLVRASAMFERSRARECQCV